MTSCLVPRLSQLCGGCGAGQFVVSDYVGVGPIWRSRGKSGGDEGAAELGEHVFEGGFGPLVVPGFGGVAAGEVVGMVAGHRVPDDHQGLHEEPEWHGALDGTLHAVAGPGRRRAVACRWRWRVRLTTGRRSA